MSSNTSAPDDYFNDLSRQPNSGHSDLESPPDRSENPFNGEEHGLPRPKRIACIVCRKRKLKCNGDKPSCGTCSRLGHTCAYDEIRRKSGPKRGYVKELEARLAQVETQLKTKININKPMPNELRRVASIPVATNVKNVPVEPSSSIPNHLSLDLNLGFDQSSWEMIDLGLEEPLPTQEAIDGLHDIFFEQIHASIPLIHKYRYRAAMNLAPIMRPPVCLRYAMWCLAASVSDKYFNHQEIFYRRARKYAEADEMKGQGEAFVSLGHTQCWILLASYEFKKMYFPRAWASSGRAARLAQMLGLNRLDGVGLDVKKTLPPPRDWTDREERRRTYWMAYCVDRYASIGTGWPMSIEEKDIMTNLPASEEAYEKSIPEQTQPLKGAMTSREMASLSPLAGVVLMAYYLGRNVTHLHRPGSNEREDDLQGDFWNRHRSMDRALLNASLFLPSHLRLPAGVRNPNVAFLNMCLHTSAICLHQAAIFKAQNNDLPDSIIEQSQARCLLAATEIATIMRLTCHLDVTSMTPFIPFCLSVASRVFVQYLKKMPNDQEVTASLEFLLNALQALKRKNPLSESFLIQLSLEIEGAGLDMILQNPDLSSAVLRGAGSIEPDSCSLVIEPRIAKHIDGNTQRLHVAFPAATCANDPKCRSDSAGTNIASLGGTQYSVQTNAAPSQEQSQSGNQSCNDDPRENLARSVRGWSVNPSSPPFKNLADSTTAFDTTMSDNISDEQRSSHHPTPSSNSSFSPAQYPQYEESESSSINVQGSASHPNSNSGPNTAAAAMPSPPAFFSFAPEDLGFPPASAPVQNQQSEPNYMNPQTWQLRSMGAASGNLTDPNQLTDETWAQISNSMMWDGTSITQEMGEESFVWTGQHGSTTLS